MSYETDLIIERVLTGLTSEAAVDRALYGYRSNVIHQEALHALDQVKDLVPSDLVGPIEDSTDLIHAMNNVVAYLLSKLPGLADLHIKSHVVHAIDVMMSAVGDLLNREQDRALLNLDPRIPPPNFADYRSALGYTTQSGG